MIFHADGGSSLGIYAGACVDNNVAVAELWRILAW